MLIFGRIVEFIEYFRVMTQICAIKWLFLKSQLIIRTFFVNLQNNSKTTNKA